MEKKTSESFRQYAHRWREIMTQVQPPLLEREITMLFIKTLKAPFINHMLGSATKSFLDIVMSGEMIENAKRCGKIDMRESAKRSALRKKENKINNASMYNKGYAKSIVVSQLRTSTTSHQDPSRQESSARPNTERLQFTPIPMSYRELYQSPFDAHVVSPFYLKPMQPPFSKEYDANAQWVKAIIESRGKRIKADIAEVKTPLRWVWEQIVNGGLITQDSEERPKRARKHCEFHAEEGHNIQECTEFRTTVQNLMDNKEIEFYEEIKGSEKGEVNASDEGSNEAEIQITPRVIIQKPVSFLYKDRKRVLWNYDCNVTILGEKNPTNASRESQYIDFYTRSGRRYDPASIGTKTVKGKTSIVKQKKKKTVRLEPPVNEPVTENEAREFLKFLKHSDYSVLEQLHKQSARISVLSLLLSLETHRSVLMKVLNETYVANDISVNKLDHLVNSINADNFIFFNNNEIPPGGMGSTKALQITTCCKGYILPSVLIDNGSVLNVLPLSMLNRLPVDSSHMKTY
ncbi:uncharacterized protein [Gossypium hirsutum]|uniref:Uncharacterized protein n=1 Tax=Gossypium hirsutum TaxID=3635 RepID=A0A1U8M4F0_GOSHI|nr:uncharacterized protein LOC107933898 [Gossypium hirsutum]